jgi:hypothetical protein
MRADTGRLADRLRVARVRGFVGRDPELESFRLALLEPGGGCNVLYVHGPGGIGKTSLLHQYTRLAREAGATTVRIDGRSVDPSPTGLLLALGAALEPSAASDPIDMLASLPRAVLMFDTYEALAPIDAWLRESLLPALPARTVVVLAGRNLPPTGWRTDPGWRELLRVLPLRNLSPAECRTFLHASGVAATQHEHVLEFTHGHPLALSLVADMLAQGGDNTHFVAAHEPDVVRVLLEKLVDEVPGPLQQQALRLSALVRVTNEALLAALFPDADARALFDWLASLSFIEHGRHGLFPHDLARDVLVADFRWRDPTSYWELLARARDFHAARLRDARGIEQRHAFIDATFLLRDIPAFRPYYEWGRITDCYSEAAKPGDVPEIAHMVERHEGPASARLAEYWFDRQPQAFTVIRGAERKLIGFLVELDLHEATAEDVATDPAARVAWEYAERHGPLRPGEEILLQRFWMDHEAYQYASVSYLLISSILVSTYVSRPRLAWSFHPGGVGAEYWEPILGFINFQRCEAADFEVGGRRYTNWVHDWRMEPGPEWLAGIGERGLIALRGEAVQPPAPRAPLIVLSEPAFAEAVRQALRDYARPAALASNPLRQSRVLMDHAGQDRSTSALQALLRAAAESLRGSPRSEKFFRAIERTYLSPAPSQERAAEALGLPFNTYRYQLGNGIARITEWLWQRELRGPVE